jgi:predicted ATP-dependent endonuclease of OLD family
VQLIKVGLEGYARFRERQELDVDAPLVALIGPNEAGKTSLLRALLRLNDDRPFDDREPSRDRQAPAVQVWARYVLDDEDRADMPAEAKKVRQLVVTKDSDGELIYHFEPEIRRWQPTRVRNVERAKAKLPAPMASPEGEELDDRQNGINVLAGSTRKALDALAENKRDTIEAPARSQLQTLRDQAGALELEELFEALDEVVLYETNHPYDEARQVAADRRPAFVEFTAEDRDLADRTSLDEVPNAALENLLALGGTSFAELEAAEADRGRLRGLLKDVNARINQAMGSWGQADVEVELDVDARVLEVLVRTSPAGYIEFSRRSSGLRMFVALRAFVAYERLSAAPILLIDEAEVHLHYDAQADLVRVLSSQQEAASVIYTTHSVGCLPADLGAGLRAVEPLAGDDGVDRSRLVASFFESEHGIRPLLVALGAGTFAMALRRAVFVEGISDAVLLPVLLRQVTGLEDMGFQVLPGVSKASAEHARELEASAAGVAYLLDGDQAGRDKRQEMTEEWCISEARVLLLPEDRDGLGDTTLEDMLGEELYRQALQRQLERWYDDIDLSSLTLPARDRSGAVKAWAESKELSVPSKAAVAARVLELRRDAEGQPVQLVAPEFRLPLRKLAKALGKLVAL